MLTRTRVARQRERDLIRVFETELARRDEMIQSLLDRIQHPDRTPVWREPAEPPPPPADPWADSVADPDQIPA